MSRHKLTVGREGCYHSPNAPPLGQDPGYHSQVAGVFVSVEQGRYIVAMKTTCLVRNREGLCYELAGKVMLDEPGAERFTLVHGSVYWTAGLRIGHAWIETGDGRVWDPVENVYYASEFYYRINEAVAERRYTRSEAAGMLRVQRYYGPWHDD